MHVVVHDGLVLAEEPLAERRGEARAEPRVLELVRGERREPVRLEHVGREPGIAVGQGWAAARRR